MKSNSNRIYRIGRTCLILLITITLIAPALADDETVTATDETEESAGGVIEGDVSSTTVQDGNPKTVTEEDVGFNLFSANDHNLQITEYFGTNFNREIISLQYTVRAKDDNAPDVDVDAENMNWLLLRGDGSSVDTGQDTTFQSYSTLQYSVCTTDAPINCDVVEEPDNFLNPSDEFRTRFTDQTQDADGQSEISIDYQAVQADVDDTKPQTRNTFQNRTLMTVHDTVLLQAEGFDNWNLSNAFLATNETGEWENKTDSYGSPQVLYSYQTWETTGFEWKNDSMTGNKSVHWRIWYNDTSGQHSVTETNSFRVRENFNYKEVAPTQVSYKKKRPRSTGYGRALSQAVRVTSIQRRIGVFDRIISDSIRFDGVTDRGQVIKPLIAQTLGAEVMQERNQLNQRTEKVVSAVSNSVTRRGNIARAFSSSIDVEVNEISSFIGARFKLTEVQSAATETRFQNLERINTEIAEIGTAEVRSAFNLRAVEDAVSVQDPVETSSFLGRSFSTAVQSQTVGTRTLVNGRFFEQGIDAGLQENRQAFSSRTVLTSVERQDNNFRTVLNSRVFSQGIASQSRFISSQVLDRAFNSVFGVQRAEDRSISGFRLTEEGFNTDTAQFQSTSLMRAVSEGFSFTETSFTDRFVSRLVQTSIQAIDRPTGLFSGSRSLNTALKADETTNAASFLARTDSFDTAFSSNTERAILSERVLASSFTQSSAVSRSSVVGRVFSQTFTTQEEVLTNFKGLRLVSDTFNAEANEEQDLALFRTEASIITQEQTFESSSVLNRAIVLGLESTELTSTSSSLGRFLGTSLEVAENVNSEASIERLDSLNAQFSSENQRSILSQRSVTNTLIQNSALSRSNAVNRAFAQTISSQQTTLSNLDVFRLISEGFNTDIVSEQNLALSRIETSVIDENNVVEASSVVARTQFTNVRAATLSVASSDVQRYLRTAFNLNEDSNGARLVERIEILNAQFSSENQRSILSQRNVANTFIQNSALSRSSAVNRVFAQTFSSQQDFFRNLDASRLISEGFNADITSEQSSALSRIETSIINQNELVEASSAVVRNQFTNVGAATLSIAGSDVQRYLGTAFTVEEDSNGARLVERIESLSAAFNADVNRAGLSQRVIVDAFVQEVAVSRTSVTNRLLDSSIRTTQDSLRKVESLRQISDVFEASLTTEQGSTLSRIESSIITQGSKLESSSTLSRTELAVVQSIQTTSRASTIQRTFGTIIDTQIEQNGIIAQLRIVSESFSSSSTIQRSLIESRSFQSNIDGFTQESRSALSSRIFENAFEATSVTQSSSTVSRLIAEGFIAQDESFRQILGIRKLSATISSSTTSNSQLFQSRLISSNFMASQQLDSSTLTARSITEVFETPADGTGAPSIGRIVTESFATGVFSQGSSNLERVMISGIRTSTAEESLTEVFRIENQAVEFGSEESTLSVLERFTSTGLQFSSVSTSQSLINRALEDSYSSEILLESSTLVSRLNQESFGYISDQNTVSKTFRSISSSLLTESNARGNGIASRILVSQIEAGFETRSTSIIQRLNIDSFGSAFNGVRSVQSDRVIGQSVTGSFKSDFSLEVFRLVTEGFSGSTETSLNSFYGRNVNLETFIGETSSRNLDLARILNEDVAASDAADISSGFGRVYTSALGVEESSYSRENLFRFTSELFGAASIENRATSGLRVTGMAVSAGITESSSSDLARILSSNFEAASDTSENPLTERVISTGIGAGTNSFAGSIVFRTLETQTSVLDQSSIDSFISRVVDTDAAMETDTSVFSEIGRTIYAQAAFSGIPGTSQSSLRSLNTDIELFEDTSNSLTNIRTIYEDLEVTESSIQNSGIARTVGAYYLTSADANVATLFNRVIADTVESLDVTGSGIDIGRLQTDNLVLGDSTSSTSSLGRVFNTETLFTDASEAGAFYRRGTVTGLSFGSSLNTGRILTGAVTQQLVAGSEPTVSGELGRSVASGLELDDDISLERTLFTALINYNIGINGDQTRSVSILRQITEGLIGDFLGGSGTDEEQQSPSDGDSGSGGDGSSGSGGGGGSTGGSGGGGGGGIGGILPEDPEPELSFTQDRITVKLEPGKTSVASIELENNGERDERVNVRTRSLNLDTVRAIEIRQKDFDLEAGSERNVAMNVTAPGYLEYENASESIIRRTLVASAGSYETASAVDIIVQQNESELLDVRMEIDEKQVNEAESPDYSFEIFNMGESEKVDILLYTKVRNSSGDIVHEEKEEIAVETSVSVARDLDRDLPPGDYKMEVLAKYSDKNASTFTSFTVEENKETSLVPKQRIPNVSEILTVLAALALLLSAATNLSDYRKKVGALKQAILEFAKESVEEVENADQELNREISEIKEEVESKAEGPEEKSLEERIKEVNEKVDELEDINDRWER